MISEIREATKTKRLGHESQILQHHPLLYRDEFRDESFDQSNRCHLTFSGIIAKMATLAFRKLRHSRRAKTGTLVQHIDAGVLIQDFEQSIDIHEREFI